MKARAYGKLNCAARFRALALSAAAALVLLCPGASWARSHTEVKSGQSAKAAAAPKQSPTAKPPTKGLNTGITVHGWWKIDVRNPDGKLVRHVEFENSLDPGYSSGYNAFTPGGAAYLNNLMLGQAPVPTVWQIILTGPGGLTNAFGAQSTTNAPCEQAGVYPLCYISMPSPTNGFATSCTVQPGVGCNLSLTPQGTAPNYTGIVLSGTVNANPPGTGGTGQISTVATQVLACGVPYNLPCSAYTFWFSFTSSTNFPGAPITVSTGQTITATVAITFQ